jgi:hypothetical protein
MHVLILSFVAEELHLGENRLFGSLPSETGSLVNLSEFMFVSICIVLCSKCLSLCF